MKRRNSDPKAHRCPKCYYANVIKQRKTSSVQYHYKKDLKSKPHKNRVRMVVPGARGREMKSLPNPVATSQ